MLVYLSWSGDRSRAVATALDGWLQTVIQGAIPWMSPDIEKGAAWFATNAAKLREAGVGVLCLTPENSESAWIHFEAGALWKALDHSRVCPYLFDMGPTDLRGPLANLQLATSTMDETYKLMQTVNNALDGGPLPDEVLKKTFEALWPSLNAELSRIGPASTPRKPRRSDREIAEETLSIVRQLAKTSQERSKGITGGLMGGAVRLPAGEFIPAGEVAALADDPWQVGGIDPAGATRAGTHTAEELLDPAPIFSFVDEPHDTPSPKRHKSPGSKKEEPGKR